MNFPEVNVPFRRTVHLSSVIPENDTRGSVSGDNKFPRREQGSNLGPLAPEASALTSELPRSFKLVDYLQEQTEKPK